MKTTYQAGTDDLVAGGTFNWRYVADVYYQGVRRYQDLPITQPKFTDDGTAKVQGTGSCTVVYQGLFADSIAPRDATAMLAPFGAELAVYVLVFAGGQMLERIEMGWYRITENPSIEDHLVTFLGRQLVAGSTVELTLQDRMQRPLRDEFDVPTGPRSRASVLAEVRRLTGLQITAEVPDQRIPNGVVYQDSKLDAAYDLVDVLDALPYMRPDGTLGQRPNDWPAQVDVIRAGNGGTLVQALPVLSNAKVYNRVAVLSTGGSAARLLGSAELLQGPLRAREPNGSPSPYGTVTYQVSSPYVTTRSQADAYARRWMPRVSNLRAGTRTVTELFNPLREVGDVVAVRPQSRADWFVGRILGIERSKSPTMDMTLEVTG
jgi:hypothetical protein